MFRFLTPNFVICNNVLYVIYRLINLMFCIKTAVFDSSADRIYTPSDVKFEPMAFFVVTCE